MKNTKWFVVYGTIALSACSTTPVEPVRVVEPVEPQLYPGVDNSAEIATCIIAADRIRKYIENGMTKEDVRRLVGKPFVSNGTSYHWSNSSTVNTPSITLNQGKVTGFRASDSGCDQSGNT